MTESSPPRCSFHSPATPCCSFLCSGPSHDEPHPPLTSLLTLQQHISDSETPQEQAIVSETPEHQATTTETEEPASMRFRFASHEELEELTGGVVPENTTKSTKWALKTFHSWCEARRKATTAESVPSDLLTNPDVDLLNKYIAMFAVEARKANGEPYPPATLHYLLCGLLRYMRELTPDCPNFLDKQDKKFKKLHNTLDSHFHKLHSQGIGRNVQHAEVFTVEEEEKLWETKVCGLQTPAALQNAAFYVVGKMFCLRGGIEHRELKVSQMHRFTKPDRYLYVENVSKTRNGSFKQLHVKNKEVPIYACPEAGNRCPVLILDTYISKLPADNDVFYLRPLDRHCMEDGKPWFSSVPVGKNTLNNKIKKMCQQAGISGNKTNHSLRATGATDLYQNGVPEKIIQERTGHRSIEALRVYEHTNSSQQQAVSNILSGQQPQMSLDFYRNQPTAAIASSSHISAVTRMQQFPGVQFLGNLHGCTVNINMQSQAPKSSISAQEREFDELISLVPAHAI